MEAPTREERSKSMWAFSAGMAALLTIIATLVGGLVRALLSRLSSEQLPPRNTLRKGMVGFGFGGALLGLLTGVVSLVFWLLFGVRPISLTWIAFHMIAVTGAGVLGTYAGIWITGHFLRKF
jgi:hypothetical protein